ncbi:hypothetical protein [Burkholderia cenocepacia]|uniref:hypothetical protein n=1 Tax=Burkholderia cenocepacia TaxID=95486 RepID=UPI001BA38E8A|nr:hypothetical protein [Burkholderia cenocepacia]
MAALINLWMIASAAGAVYLLNGTPRQQRWGAVVGLVGQPAWLYLTWSTLEWGMFVVSVFFTGCYVRGVWRGFFQTR